MLADTNLAIGPVLVVVALVVLGIYLAGRIFGRGFKDSGKDD